MSRWQRLSPDAYIAVIRLHRAKKSAVTCGPCGLKEGCIILLGGVSQRLTCGQENQELLDFCQQVEQRPLLCTLQTNPQA